MSRYVAVEMSDDAMDNRPLGKSGCFLTGSYSESDIALFPSADSALNIASQAPNARPGLTIEAIGQSRKVKA